MAARKVKIGMIGCGGYGRSARHHFRKSGAFDIVACLDTNPDIVAQAAQHESATAYGDLDAFLAHPGMEAVSISTPVLLHHEHALRSLQAGKHVFTTKPITNRVSDALALKAEALGRNLAFMVGFHARHMAPGPQLREIIKSGRLGTLCNISIHSCSSGGLAQKEGDWRTIAGENPGGPLLQCGCHSIDFLCALLGPVRSVMATMQDHVTEFDVVDNAHVLMRFDGGVTASMISNYTTAYYHSMHFFGTKANLHSEHHITGLGQKQIYVQDRAHGAFEPRVPLVIENAQYDFSMETAFAEQILSDRPNYTNMDDATHVQRVIEAAVKSADSGQQVPLDD